MLKRLSSLFFLSVALHCAFAGSALAGRVRALTASQPVYSDALQNGWQSYGWAALNYANSDPVHSGSASISVTAGPYQALYVHHTAQDSSPYVSLTFWINGGTAGGQKLQVQATLSGTAQSAVAIAPLTANAWQQVTIPLSQIGAANNPNFDGFWIQDTTGAAEPTFYVDDVTLNSGTTPPTSYPAVSVSVDAGASRHPISPLIYGVNYGDATTLADLNSPVNRYGGNNTSRYNWQQNADNRASDYFFESIGDASATPGERGDSFFSASLAGGAQALITIPTIDWVAKLGANRSKIASFSVAKYGAQQSTDPYFPDAGNGVSTDGKTNVTGNDPNDANTPNSPAMQQAWVQHLVGTWGTAAAGGVKYYVLDNEPSLWQATHRDVHPNGPGMDEIRDKMLSYSAAIKAADPSALTVGPEEWGYLGYIYSGADQQYRSAHGYSGAPDRDAHGGMDYIPYLLRQFHQHDLTSGTRSLDVLSVHFYPQAGEFSDDTSTTMQQLRNRGTRQLWDPNYVSESYIKDKTYVIPLLQSWVSAYDPGLQTAITEYNWGAENHINGATTQADILGIFGREGLDMATRWTVPASSTPTYQAMKLYRNYDNSKSTFGDTSVLDTSPDPDNLSSFAAVRSFDGALTVMVVAKTVDSNGTRPLTVSIANFAALGTAQVWQITSAGTISHLPDVTFTGSSLTTTVPAQSVTLFVVPAARTVAGVVTLQNWTGPPQPLTFTLSPTNGTTGPVITQTLTPANGSFTLNSVPAGTYILGIKGASWLQKDITISTTTSSVSGLSASLLPGDLNGDNVVSLSDLAILRAAYGSSPTSANWNPQADLNDDGVVSLSDLAILRSNYGKTGDP